MKTLIIIRVESELSITDIKILNFSKQFGDAPYQNCLP